MNMRLPLLCAAVFALSSCSLLYQRTESEETVIDQERGANGAGELTQGEPAENPLNPSRGVGTNFHVNNEEELLRIDNGADGEVYFTDPNNPDKDIEGITAAFERNLSNERWFTNYRKARQAAAQERKPLIIWFHDSVASPKSNKLRASLLETPYFEDWAAKNAIRVCLDSSLKQSGNAAGKKVYSMNVINGFAAQCGVRRRPAVVVAAADGYIVGRIDGCNPDELNVVDSEIRRYVEEAKTHFAAYQQKLEAKGFRMWKGRTLNSPTLLARMQKYDREEGIVYLTEFTGRVHQTRYNRLSQSDRDWIDAQIGGGKSAANAKS